MSRSRPDLLRNLVRMVTAPDLDASSMVLREVRPSDARTVVLLARAHGVEAWLSACVPSTWPGEIVSGARRQRLAFLAALARQRALLTVLCESFADADVPWVVLKGLALADRVYPRPDLRYGVDVDVLVPPRHFERALNALHSEGLLLLDRNWPLIRALEVGELRLRCANGLLVDLHWDLLSNRSLRRRFTLPVSGLLARAVIGGSGWPYRRLDDVDEVLHVSLHAALAGGNRLLWLLDVDRLLRQPEVDWGQLAARAREAGCERAVALVFERCRAHLGTPIPVEVLVRLGGHVWRTWCAWVDHRAPLPDDPLAPSLARATSRAVRPGTVASFGALAGHAAAWAVHRHGEQTAPWLDPDHPTSAMHDVDSSQDRTAYLQRVVRVGEGTPRRCRSNSASSGASR